MRRVTEYLARGRFWPATTRFFCDAAPCTAVDVCSHFIATYCLPRAQPHWKVTWPHTYHTTRCHIWKHISGSVHIRTVKVKLLLPTPRRNIRGEGGGRRTAPLILNLGTRWRRWSNSRAGGFTPENNPRTQCMETGCVPVEEEENLLLLPVYHHHIPEQMLNKRIGESHYYRICT